MHEKYIKRTFKLAKKAGSSTYPNPLVGAVIIKAGKIIGEGYHHGFGKDHAEIEAIKKCGAGAKDATIYVNLEPCCHFGKTPPCTDAIIKAGIKKVIFSNRDPFLPTPKTKKRQLQKNGVKVISGILKQEGKKLNEIYFHYLKTGMPFVAIKVATSLDGKIATKTGSSKWITNEKARKYARQLRGNYQAILVGAGTVRKDNPHLGCRTKVLKDPLRIILGSIKPSKKYKVFRDNNYITINKLNKTVFKNLAKQGIISIFVEGGAKTISSIIDQNLAQKIYWFQAPKIIGGEASIPAIKTKDIKNIKEAINLKNIEFKTFDDNQLITAKMV